MLTLYLHMCISYTKLYILSVSIKLLGNYKNSLNEINIAITAHHLHPTAESCKFNR